LVVFLGDGKTMFNSIVFEDACEGPTFETFAILQAYKA